jgi:hypothetical protein
MIVCSSHFYSQKKDDAGGIKRRKPHCQSLFIPLVPLLPSEVVRKLLQRAADKLGLFPEVGGQEGVSVRDGSEGGLQRVFEGLGGTRGLSVGVLNTSKLHETLDGGGSDKASTTRSGDQLKSSVLPRCPLSLNQHTRTVTEPHFPDSLAARE